MPANSSQKPNILLVVPEDMGRHLGCYGNRDARTPHLDRFAQTGLRFDNAWCSQPVCTAARSTLFTGLPPHRNGSMGLATVRFACFEGVPSLPALLSSAGYRTALLGKHHVLPEEQFQFDFRWKGENFHFFTRDYPSMIEAADRFLRSDNTPFFLMAALPDAHVPLLRQSCGEPKAPMVAGDVGIAPGMDEEIPEWPDWYADYHNCVTRADAAFGGLLELLDRRGLRDDTLVIFLSDHGFQFPRGKYSLYEQGLGIPLLVGGAGVESAGKAVAVPVCGEDVFATVLSAAGAPLPPETRGRPLLELAAEQPEDRCIFGERTACTPSIYFPQRAVRDRRFKLIRTLFAGKEDPHFRQLAEHDNERQENPSHRVPPMPDPAHLSPSMRAAYQTWQTPPEFQLYDLEKDPLETVNLADVPAMRDVASRLKTQLEEWMRATRDFVLHPDLVEKFSAEIAGYLRREEAEGKRPKDFAWHYFDYLPPRSSID